MMLLQSPAPAGGWWTTIDAGPSPWAPGLRVETGAAEALFPSLDAADRAYESGDYGAYLLDDFDYGIVDRALRHEFRPDWWTLAGASAIPLGDVVLGEPDGNLVRASASFVVPDVAPGRYYLMFCDPGCERAFADVIPTRVTVVEDLGVAALTGRVDTLRDRLDRLTGTLRPRTRRLEAQVVRLERLIAGLYEARAEERRAPEVGSTTGQSSGGVPAFLGWTAVFAGALALFTLWVHRRRPTGP